MDEDNYCEYFLEHTENSFGDDYVFKFRGILMCANQKCPYDNQIGKAIQFDGEGDWVMECESNGFKNMQGKSEGKLEKVVEKSGVLKISV